MNALIGQAPTLPAPTTAPPLIEGGMGLAIAIYLVKEGIAFFKRKDASEEQLTKTLIDDLRTERNQHLQQTVTALQELKASNEKIAVAIAKMAEATEQIHLANQMNARTNTEILAQLQRQERILLSLTNSQSNGTSLHQPGNSR